ncbi:HAD-IA family hydrolase [Cerasicoccus maritimus]|uniref:HAD-IA family hydrolase n=1 Tax=Cerasicoccus maritimus TaxID=490089 RepID=UPI002852885C|nr:HAD-IA family hydrolase [Cerasicoccus maritimus]
MKALIPAHQALPICLDSIAAITFDAAGTLIEPYPSVGEVYAEELALLGYPLDSNLLETRFRASFKALKTNRPGAVLDRVSWREIVSGTLDGLTPAETFDSQFDALWNSFAQAKRWRILPGAEAALQKLQARGLRLFVLSNNDARLHGVIDGLGLAGYFEQVFVSEQFGVEKPNPEIFHRVREVIGAPTDAILHVGDSPAEDIEGALNAGWRAALVGPKASVAEFPTAIIRAANIEELFAE